MKPDNSDLILRRKNDGYQRWFEKIKLSGNTILEVNSKYKADRIVDQPRKEALKYNSQWKNTTLENICKFNFEAKFQKQRILYLKLKFQYYNEWTEKWFLFCFSLKEIIFI